MKRVVNVLLIVFSILLLTACDGVKINVNLPNTDVTSVDSETGNEVVDASSDTDIVSDDTDTSDQESEDSASIKDNASDETNVNTDDNSVLDDTDNTTDDTSSDNTDNAIDDTTTDNTDNAIDDTTTDNTDNATDDTTTDNVDDATDDTTSEDPDETTNTIDDSNMNAETPSDDNNTQTIGSERQYFDVCKYDQEAYEYTCGVLDSTGAVVFPVGPYEVYVGFGDVGIAPIYYSEINQYRYINTSGDIMFGTQTYDFAGKYNEGLSAVELNGKWGFINTSGETVIPLEYTNVSMFYDNGYAFASKDYLWGMIDKQGQVIIDFEYTYLELFAQDADRIIASTALGYRVLALDGTVIGNYDQSELYPYAINNNGLAAVWNSDTAMYGFVDNTGDMVVDFIYDNIGWGHLKNTIVPVSLDGTWGYIDQTGAVVIDYQFAYAEGFSNGLAAVATEGESWGFYNWGYINTLGTIVIPMDYQSAGYFTADGYAKVFNESFNKYDFINATGTPEWRLWDFAYDYNNGYAIVGANMVDDQSTAIGVKWGVIDTEGMLVIPLEYDYIMDLTTILYW